MDRLIASLSELAFSLEDAHDTLKKYHKKNRKDMRVLERVRIMQATYLVQSSVGDLALRSLSVEKRPETQPVTQQVVNIQDDEEGEGEAEESSKGQVSTAKSDHMFSDFNDENSQAK